MRKTSGREEAIVENVNEQYEGDQIDSDDDFSE
jgi:hypothetical protein